LEADFAVLDTPLVDAARRTVGRGSEGVFRVIVELVFGVFVTKSALNFGFFYKIILGPLCRAKKWDDNVLEYLLSERDRHLH